MMTKTITSVEDICDYWNRRAGLGKWAGTRDVIAKQLEIEAFAGHVRDGMRILDVGCGNGITAIELARRFAVEITGIDYAEEMIRGANSAASNESLKGHVCFRAGNVNDLSEVTDRFDLIYTERTLINLPDWMAQKKAIESICGLLVRGGRFLMCENSQDGLDKLNTLREKVGLAPITPPWHNRYLRDVEIGQMIIPDIEKTGEVNYSSTYYFLSRVVNAALAAQSGAEPDYDSPINHLALKLPSFGDCGQGRIWVWAKIS